MAALATIPARIDARDKCVAVETEPRIDLRIVPERPGLALGPEEQAEAEQRYAVIEPLVNRINFAGLWREHGDRTSAVIAALSAQHSVRPRTIYRWVALFEAGGISALASRGRSDRGKPKVVNSAALDFLIAAALPKNGAYGALSCREIYRAYNEEKEWRAAHIGRDLTRPDREKYSRYVDESGKLAARAALPKVSYETLRLWIAKIPEPVRIMGRDGKEAFANTEILSFRDISALRPLDYVVMDHRRLDIFCLIRQRDGWKLARPWLTAAIDMRTRKWLSWVIVENPSSDSIAAVLKRTFLDHGLPGALYWDNGKDFTCHWLEGRVERARKAAGVGELGAGWRGVLNTLGVRVHHAIVKRARAKIIEPNFVSVANFDKTLPWWCGHRPGARPERFDEMIEQHEKWLRGEISDPAFPHIEEVARIYDEAFETLNERDHTGEGMEKITPTGRGWMCPNGAWEKFAPSVSRRELPEDVLAFAFAKRRDLTVRNGEICATFGGVRFHYRMGDAVRLMALNGREVQIGYDPLDLGTVALYREGSFLGLAHNVELRRMGESAFIQDEKDRRATGREIRRFIADVHKQVPVPDYRERAERRRAIAPARIEPRRPVVPASLPAAVTDAAAAAAEDRRFSFAAAPAESVAAVRSLPVFRDDEDEFRFYKDQGGDCG